ATGSIRCTDLPKTATVAPQKPLRRARDDATAVRNYGAGFYHAASGAARHLDAGRSRRRGDQDRAAGGGGTATSSAAHRRRERRLCAAQSRQEEHRARPQGARRPRAAGAAARALRRVGGAIPPWRDGAARAWL